MSEVQDNLNSDLNDEEDLYRAISRLTQLYTDKTHLVYELLQNAEDCKAESVKFIMHPDRLEFWHTGKPFTQSNITRIRSVGDSDKPINDIGKFGVGFKSVFSICKIVEIYSEPDNYPIRDNDYLPRFANRIEKFRTRINIPFDKPLEKKFTTRFVFPFCVDKEFSGYKTIENLQVALKKKLKLLGADVMLFLNHINVIEYEIIKSDGTISSQHTYLLQNDDLGNNCFKVTTAGKNLDHEPDLSFIKYKKAFRSGIKSIDLVFRVEESSNDIPIFVDASASYKYISVYFPTETESKLKFTVQAPFATTPNRGGVPVDENKEIAILLSELLHEAVIDIRNRGWLSLDFLNLLPFTMPALKEGEEWLFEPLYNTSIDILENEDIFPVLGGGYENKANAKLARGAELTKIFTNHELELLVGKDAKWLPTKSANVNFTENDSLFGDLYKFFIKTLKIEEIGNDDIAKYLRDDINTNFLKNVNDDTWLETFYNYLADKVPAKLGKRQDQDYSVVPFIKTQTGIYVSAYKLTGRERLANVYKHPLNASQGLTSFNLVADFIQKNCGTFLDKMDIKYPDEYDYFVEELKDSNNDEGINESKNISQLNKALKYLSENRSDVVDVLKKYLKIKCTNLNGEAIWVTCSGSSIFFATDPTTGVSLYDYFFGTECSISILDDNYYINNGITRDDMRRLEMLGLQDSTNIIRFGDESFNEGGLSSKNCGDFKKYLDFNYIGEVLLYINKYSKLDTAKDKSKALFSLLKTTERYLKGEWVHGSSSPVFKNDVSDIIKKLNGSSYVFANNTIIYTRELKWIYSKDGKLVLPSEITRFELDSSIYGDIDQSSNIYDILGFKPTEQEESEKLISDFNSQYSEQEKALIFKHFLPGKQLMKNLQDEDGEFDPYVDVDDKVFPEEPIHDIERLKKQTEDNYLKASDVEYVLQPRLIRTSRGNDRVHIKNRYEGFCQICKTPSKFWEVAEIFNNPVKEMEDMNLSLCPNCASMYRQLRNKDKLMASFANKIRHASPETDTIIPLGHESRIRFTQAHLAEIQVILGLDKSVPSLDDGEES